MFHHPFCGRGKPPICLGVKVWKLAGWVDFRRGRRVQVEDSSSPFQAVSQSFNLVVTVAGETGHSVLLNWDASPSSVATGYNVYRSGISGSAYRKINATPISALTYTDGSAMSGQVYYYVMTSVDSSGDESGFSTELQIVIP
jgi:fibronectin type 3 domain-containing protein